MLRISGRPPGDHVISDRAARTLSPDYWKLWIANGINAIGDGAFAAALPLLAVSLTRDPIKIALLGAAAYVPWLMFSLPAGAYVDRHSNVNLMTGFQAVQAVVAAVVTLSVLSGHTTIWFLAACNFILGATQVVISNAAQTAVPLYVNKSQLQRANGYQQVMQTLGQSTAGPPVGAALFVAAAAFPFALDSITFLGSVLLLASISARHVPQKTVRREFRSDIAEGLRWLMSHRLLRILALMLGMNTFCYQLAFTTLVLLATGPLHLSPHQYGWMLVGAGIGGIWGGFANHLVVRTVGEIPSLCLAYLINGLCYIGMGTVSSGLALAVLLGVSGFTVTVTGVVTVSLRHFLVPQELLGRVNSVYKMVGWGLMPVGAVSSGIISDMLGPRAPSITAGVVRLVVLMITLPSLIAFVGSRRESDASTKSSAV